MSRLEACKGNVHTQPSRYISRGLWFISFAAFDLVLCELNAARRNELGRAVGQVTATYLVLIGRSHGELGRLTAHSVQVNGGQQRCDEMR